MFVRLEKIKAEELQSASIPAEQGQMQTVVPEQGGRSLQEFCWETSGESLVRCGVLMTSCGRDERSPGVLYLDGELGPLVTENIRGWCLMSLTDYLRQ